MCPCASSFPVCSTSRWLKRLGIRPSIAALWFGVLVSWFTPSMSPSTLLSTLPLLKLLPLIAPLRYLFPLPSVLNNYPWLNLSISYYSLNTTLSIYKKASPICIRTSACNPKPFTTHSILLPIISVKSRCTGWSAPVYIRFSQKLEQMSNVTFEVGFINWMRLCSSYCPRGRGVLGDKSRACLTMANLA